MLLLPLLPALLAAQEPPPTNPAPPPVQVLVMGVEARAGAEPELAGQVTALVANTIGTFPGHKVLTPQDIAEMAQAAREREMLGEGGDDVIKLADAGRGLNASYVVSGTIGRAGSSLVLTLMRVEVKTSQPRSETVTFTRVRELPEILARICPVLMGISTVTEKPRYRLPVDKKVSLAVMDLSATGVPNDVVANLTQVLSAEIKKVENTSVVSRADIQAMLQMEATKSLAGCDQEGCLAEIGGALGVDKLVAGSVGKVGGSYIINLRLIAVSDVSVENRATETFNGAEDQLLHALRQAARNLLGLQVLDKGALSVTASQPGAEVIVDGQRAGAVPLAPVSGLAVGPHTVEIEKSGYARWIGDAYIHPNETTPIWVNLQPLPPKFWQRPIFWVAVLVGGGVGVAIPLVVVGVAASVASIGVANALTPPQNGKGSGTVSGVP